MVVLRNFEEQHIVWESIQVGDLVRIHEREAIPADGILLASSEENGNLSVDSKMYSLSEKQFLPRGSTLMNTKWVMLLVVYTGHDTKVMKNARAAHHKLSHLDLRLSRTVVFVFFIQVLLCAIAACVHHFYFDASVLQHVGDNHSKSQETVLLFLSFIVLMNTLIPISLVVTVEIIKTVHAKFITWDNKMRSTNGQGAMANTSSLTDELGQVKYIFTDKTDKLQVGVPETISLFQKAGIKIWVLTGDKLETSLEMGKLCRVVTPKMQEVIIRGATRHEMTQQLEKALENSKESQAVLIDGSALTLALLPANRKNFLKLALQSATVIVCRASPIQKALVVELVKAGVPDVTLAVGDGANDVSMIRAAHVGVGVMGQEGMQAVRSADYAVQQFSHLGRLLLYHGRLSYLRTTQCIDYFLYKNIVFTLPHFIYGIASAFSAQTFFCDLYITAYNVVFTALPVTVRAVMETDLLEAIAAKFPELYRFGATNMFFSHRDSFWAASVASFFYIVPIVHFQIFFETWNWTWLICLTYALSLGAFFMCIAVYDHFTGDIEGVWRTVIARKGFWLGFALASVACILPVVAYKWYVMVFSRDSANAT
ncbi:hypothetical protein JG687_00006390 [Phytophthora cactorum]|uniref:P-type phospholipid transporter n=1 Tax=Phytophthora cactorum TaxID=29920 RepID=A0A8T1UI19_9STRA|nr:hypothetical protein JG687_00006390 [Phytophthora cactorum]